MSDAIGALGARVILQKPTRIADEIGGAAIAWSDQGAVWASIEVTSAGESTALDATAAIASFRVTINRRDDVRVGWRLVWGARLLRVRGVADDGAPRLVLSCEEEKL